MQSRSLQGKVILITGASSGIGKALAEECARRGASVVLAARRKEKLDTIAAEIREDGGKALAVTTDVSKESDVKRMVDAAVKRFGRIDVLVNNAGYGIKGRMENTTSKELLSIFSVNLFGLHYCCRAVVPVMKRQKGGHIINISSVAGLIPHPLLSAYCATKAAVNLLTDTLRMELAADNLNVSLICPGPVKTNFYEREALLKKGERRIKAPKWACLEVETMAQIIIGCILKPKRRIITSPIWLWWLAYRHFPRLVERFTLLPRLKG